MGKRLFLDGEELLNHKHLMDTFDLTKFSNLHVDSSFDLNSKWHGFKTVGDDLPKNGIKVWSLYADFELDDFNRIQLCLSLDNIIEMRSFSGKGVWSAWKKIGGVLSRLLTHLFCPRKVAA